MLLRMTELVPILQSDAGVAYAGEAADVLPALHEEHRGTVRLCYLDPPYNGGRRIRNYSDRSGRGEWYATLTASLSAMEPLLAPSGSVWLHLDDAAQHYGRMALDEVFGPRAFVATIIWQKRQTRENRSAFSIEHEYIHVYAPAGKAWREHRNKIDPGVKGTNPDNDPRGPWRRVMMEAQDRGGRPTQHYTITTPTGVEYDPGPGCCWRYTRERFEELVADGRVFWPRNGDGKPCQKVYTAEVGDKLVPSTIWTAEQAGTTGDAKKGILSLFGTEAFDTPKPTRLLERIIQIASDPGDLVLDYYLGSGTTAVAAERLGRRWLGIDRNEETLREVTARRLAISPRPLDVV